MTKREGENNSWQRENEKRGKKECEEKGETLGKGKEKDDSFQNESGNILKNIYSEGALRKKEFAKRSTCSAAFLVIFF